MRIHAYKDVRLRYTPCEMHACERHTHNRYTFMRCTSLNTRLASVHLIGMYLRAFQIFEFRSFRAKHKVDTNCPLPPPSVNIRQRLVSM
jgi:hypothetical protein